MTTLLQALEAVGLLALAVAAMALRQAIKSIRSRGEVSGTSDDDWMDIAEVVSDDHHPEDCTCEDIGLDGVTPEDQAVLERNWLALTEGERDELYEVFEAIVEGADR